MGKLRNISRTTKRHALFVFAFVATMPILAPGQTLSSAGILSPVESIAPSSQADFSVIRHAPREPVQPGPPLREPDTAWIESTLASMTLDEKVGQMIMPGYSPSTADGMVNDWHVGGFIFQGNNNTAMPVMNATNYLQGITNVPLIFSTDCEAGLGARFTDATRFPLNMGSAAAYDLDLVRQQGRVTARECRAIGIQIGFGPVLDVNTEPVNPIIGIRSYSDNPTSVSELARAYVEGAHAEGLLCTFKHFPGHGGAAGDSHLGLPTINISAADIQADHVSPYATLISEGWGDLVMTAHVWYPALDPGTTPWPATLSNVALTDILRNQLSYDGCVISDSFAMGGLVDAAPTYDAVKYAVLAGVDIILTPAGVEEAFNGIKDRVVTTQEIPESRIDAAVRRILALKSRVGMPESVTVPTTGLSTVGHPDNSAIGEAIGRKTICAETEQGFLPVTSSESLGLFVFESYSTVFYSYPPTVFTGEMVAAHSNTQVISVSSFMLPGYAESLITQAENFDKVLFVSMDWHPKLNYQSQINLVNEMIDRDLPVGYISFGSPYQWDQFADLENFLCGFSSHYATQQQMAQVITGDADASQNWPVNLDKAPAEVADWAVY